MAGRVRRYKNPPLPRTQPAANMAFYYDTTSMDPAGFSAIVYLPCYNADIRERHQKAGLRILSEVEGDISLPGESALKMLPPSMATCEALSEELQALVPQFKDDVQAQIEEIEEGLKNGDYTGGGERRLQVTRKRQLQARLDAIDDDVPTAARLNAFFKREHQMKAEMEIPRDIRTAVQKLRAEEQLDLEATEAERDVARAMKGTGGSAPVAPSKRSRSGDQD